MRYFRKPQINVEIICRNSGLTMCESLLSYTELIKQLPYKRMCYDKTRMTTWDSFKEDKVFGPFFHNVFNTRETVKFSREELFTIVNTTEFSNAIFSIVLWGYPRGYTMGMNMKKLFQKLIDNLPILKDEIWVNRNFTRDEFNNCFNKIIFEDTGIGVSTLTKFLYFFKIKIEGYRCLILDSRIISVIKDCNFSELRSLNIYKDAELYIEYVKKGDEISKTNDYEIDQLEMFLFMFGNNLKL